MRGPASTVTHPPFGPRRSSARATTWWGRAWVRAVEEAAYAEADLRAGRSLARAGAVGGIAVGAGSVVAAVMDRGEVRSVGVAIPVLEPPDIDAFVDVVAAESGRIAALLAGELPHTLVEHAEEAGVELLPFGGELEASCICGAWLQPCAHALAVLSQVAWLLDKEPMVLLHLRGLPREPLLAALHELTAAREESGPHESGPDALGTDVETAAEAALRARRLLELADDPDAELDDLL